MHSEKTTYSLSYRFLCEKIFIAYTRNTLLLAASFIERLMIVPLAISESFLWGGYMSNGHIHLN
jgi:hypothetical protein